MYKTKLAIASVNGNPEYFHFDCLAKGINSKTLKNTKLLEIFDNNKYGNRICIWCGLRFFDIPDPNFSKDKEPFMSRFEMTGFEPEELRNEKFKKQEFIHALRRRTNPFSQRFGTALENMGKTIKSPRKKKKNPKHKNPCAPCMLMANPRKKKKAKKK